MVNTEDWRTAYLKSEDWNMPLGQEYALRPAQLGV